MTKKTKELTEKIRIFMLQSGISQKKLAKKLDLTPAAISKLLAGKSAMRTDTLAKLSAALGVDSNYFFENSFNTTGNNIAGRDNNVNKSREIKDLQLLKAEMEIVKKEIENINLKIELLKKKK